MSYPSKNRSWTQSRWWFAVPAGLCILLCALILRGGGSLYWGAIDSDLTNQFYPWQVFVRRWVSRGIFPFWDPHVFSGYPTVETQQMLALNPVHLVSLLMPAGLGLIFMMAANTVVACMGMAWGLWRWGRVSAMAAALGAVLYVAGGLFAVRVIAGHFTVVAAIAWWPLAVMSLLRLARGSSHCSSELMPSPLRQPLKRLWRRLRPSNYLLIAASALFHGMVVLAGGPQYIVYLFYIDAAVVIATARRGNFFGAVASAALVWILALALTAPQWLPALWYLPFSGRAVSAGGATGFSLQPLQNLWLEFIMPFPFGDDITRPHLHFSNVWETATYPGTLSIILTLALLLKTGVSGVRRTAGSASRRRLLLSPLEASGLLILALGGYMIVGAWLPGFGGFRDPVKARAVVAFAVALLSAAAMDGVLRRPSRWRLYLIVSALLTGAMLAAAAVYRSPERFIRLIDGFGRPMDPLAQDAYEQAISNPADALVSYDGALLTTGGFALGGLVIFLFIRRTPRLAAAGLFLLAMADPVLNHGRAWMGRFPFADVGAPAEVVACFQPHLDQVHSGAAEPFRVILHSAIINRTHHVDGLYELHGYDPLMPAFASGRMLVPGAQALLKEDQPEWRVPLLARAGVRFDAARWWPGDDPEPSSQTIVEVPKARLFDVSRNVAQGMPPGINMAGPDLNGTHYVATGRRRAGADVVVSAELREELATLGFDNNPRTSAISTLRTGELARALPQSRPDEFSLNLTLEAPALVVYKMTWLPGWRVILEQGDRGPSDQPALLANNWMVAAIAPAGESTITFRYRPVGWMASWVISGMAAVAMLGMMLATRKPRRAAA